MNATTWTMYREYLEKTGSEAAAAALTLADVMQGEADRVPAAATNQPMTVPEVAKLLRVRPNKVLAWIRSGRLRGYNVTEREQGRPKYRVNAEDLDAFMKQRAPQGVTLTGRPLGSRSARKKALHWSQPATASRESG